MNTNAFQGGTDISKARIAIVRSRFNETVTQRMLYGALKTLENAGMTENDIKVVEVPGAFEIPLAAQELAKSGQYHAVITIGCVLRGQTPHDQYISHSVFTQLQGIAVSTGIPVLLGIITPLDQTQADERSSEEANKGIEAAKSALEMVDIMKTLNQ